MAMSTLGRGLFAGVSPLLIHCALSPSLIYAWNPWGPHWHTNLGPTSWGRASESPSISPSSAEKANAAAPRDTLEKLGWWGLGIGVGGARIFCGCPPFTALLPGLLTCLPIEVTDPPRQPSTPSMCLPDCCLKQPRFLSSLTEEVKGRDSNHLP